MHYLFLKTFTTHNKKERFAKQARSTNRMTCTFSVINLTKYTLLLYGDSDISYVENITLFDIVHEYIFKSKRLKNN